MILREAAERLGAWVAPENHDVEISGVASLTDAGPGDVSFYGNPKYLTQLRKCRGTAVLVPHGFAEEVGPARIWVDNPAAAFAKLLEIFAPEPVTYQPGVHPSAFVSPDVKLGAGVSVQQFAVIEPGAIGSIRSCNGEWCQMTFGSYTGWISQSLVWGAYPGELVKD